MRDSENILSILAYYKPVIAYEVMGFSARIDSIFFRTYMMYFYHNSVKLYCMYHGLIFITFVKNLKQKEVGFILIYYSVGPLL